MPGKGDRFPRVDVDIDIADRGKTGSCVAANIALMTSPGIKMAGFLPCPRAGGNG